MNKLSSAQPNMCYRVGHHCFYSTFLAAHEGWRSGLPVTFYCFDNEYDQLDWQQEPTQSLDQLMLAHALDLRNKYPYLVLLFSGGTDSQTIYNVFTRNQIPIDHIIIKVSDTNPAYPYSHWQWLVDNHPDPHTRITKFEANDPGIREADITSADWIWTNQGDMYKFMASANGSGVQRIIESHCGGKDYAAVTGQEKPRLIYRKGHWFSRQADVILRHCLGFHYLEHFFLSPQIHLKQSHMVKRAVKQLVQQRGLPLHDGDWAEAKWPHSAQGYREWASACGRHPELTDGISHTQKKITIAIFNTVTADLASDTIESPLKEQYLARTPVALKYMQGIQALHNETRFAEWLNENFLKNPFSGQLLNTKFIWSRERNLGT